MSGNLSELGMDKPEDQDNTSPNVELSQTEGAAVNENDGVINEVETPETPIEAETSVEVVAETEAGVVTQEVSSMTEEETVIPETPVETASAVETEVTEATGEETTSAEPAEAVAPPAKSQKTKPPVDATGRRFKRGDVLEGVITRTSPTVVVVDLGEKAEGLIPGRELERMNRQTLESLQEGTTIPVYVVNPHDHQGNIILSVNRALEELDWKEAETYRQSQEVYEGQVAGYNKGGLIVRFGRLRGFVPQSQISDDRRLEMSGETPEERYGVMVNLPIAVKVMEVDRGRNRLILSERVAYREIREKRKESLVNELNVGEVHMGRVVSLEDFGAFIDIGGAEGLVHLTELSWKHVNHPKELLEIGQEVKVEVISLDRERKRIGLSLKRQAADPWDEVAINYNVGVLVQGVITKLTKFGAFAKLIDAPDIEGLVHISELSDKRVTHPREVVNEGDKLTLRVVKIDVKNRRLGLSLKRVNSAEYLDIDWFATDEQDADQDTD